MEFPEEDKVDISVRFSMAEDQCNALLRFNEACEDGQECDVHRSMMKSLTCVGMVRWCGGSRFEITDAGIAAVEDLQGRAHRASNRTQGTREYHARAKGESQ